MPHGSGTRYNAESALDSLLDDLQEFRAESAPAAAPASSAAAHRVSCYCPRICLVSTLPHAPSGASVPVCHGYGHVALELVCRESNHQVLHSQAPCACKPYAEQRSRCPYLPGLWRRGPGAHLLGTQSLGVAFPDACTCTD